MTQTTSDPRDDIVLHLPHLRAFALGLTRSPDKADDLVQDTVMKAWVHIGSFQAGTNIRSWLFTILRNTYYSDLRKRRREVPDPEGAFVARLAVKPAHDGVLALRELLVAFARLSPEHREVLTLVGALGYSYDEAAIATGLAIGTVKSRASRARAILAADLNLTSGESLLPVSDGPTSAVLAHSPTYLM
jgi:RNA polymerase sigma-70 factor, ECF subfamily